MRSAIFVALTGFALMGCIGPRGGHYVGGQFADAMIPQSTGDADYVCREELPFDMLYVPSSPLAHGLSPEEQRNRHYHDCMARLGHPDASFVAAAGATNPQ